MLRLLQATVFSFLVATVSRIFSIFLLPLEATIYLLFLELLFHFNKFILEGSDLYNLRVISYLF